MKSPRVASAAVLVVLSVTGPLSAQAPQAEDLGPQRRRQTQVQKMARELVDDVLQVQLQQLAENRLEKHPWYADAEAMRRHLDELIHGEMQQVVELLEQIGAEEGAEPTPVIAAARQTSRQIVTHLLTQRQRLLARLRIAEVAEQVQQLIRTQTAVLSKTDSLEQQPLARRESMNLAALEDQRDVRALYLRFLATLGEVSNWPGPPGGVAAEGLRLLLAGEVEKKMRLAEKSLQSADFPQAAANQRAVLQVLRAILEKTERAQGVADDGRDGPAGKIAEIIEQQRHVRGLTAEAPLGQARAEQLVDKQTAIRRQLADLSESIPDDSEVREPLERAAEFAGEAIRDLFEQEQAEALARQQSVLEQLQRAAEQAASNAEAAPGATSAAKPADSAADAAADAQGAIPGAAGRPQAGSPANDSPPGQPTSQGEPGAAPGGTTGPDPDGGSTGPSDDLLLTAPWFARLPAELRSAIRNNSRRRPPRGYEQRLRRYFEDVD